MDKGVYTALSGGIAKSHELDLIANNLANANTTGFKRDAGTFNEYLTELRHPDSVSGVGREISALTSPESRPQGDKSFVEMDAVYTDFRQGNLQKTGRTLDMALEGKGFFEVLTPAGIRYTRQGNFSISAEGRLVTNNGFPVLMKTDKSKTDTSSAGSLMLLGVIGEQKPRVSPEPEAAAGPQNRILQLGEGKVEITPEGIVRQNGVQVGQLSIEEFHESQWLEKVGHSYFRNVNADNIKTAPTESKIHQGFLEGSNVNPVAEMTRLIEATRAYESHLQAIKTYQEIDGRTVNDIAHIR
jgi:flagellar basal-body rod protein FlgF